MIFFILYLGKLPRVGTKFDEVPTFNSVESAAAARNETREKDIEDEHSGGTARGLQACLRCGRWRALSGSRHGQMLAQIITHFAFD